MNFFDDDGFVIPGKTLLLEGSQAISARFRQGYEPGVFNPERLPHYDMPWAEWVEKKKPLNISNPLETISSEQ